MSKSSGVPAQDCATLHEEMKRKAYTLRATLETHQWLHTHAIGSIHSRQCLYVDQCAVNSMPANLLICLPDVLGMTLLQGRTRASK